MRTVWEMTLSANSITEFEIPQGAEFLGAAFQPGPIDKPVIVLFALLDPKEPIQKRRVLAAVSREEIDDELADGLRHIDTVQAIPPSGRPIVVHVFEVTL